VGRRKRRRKPRKRRRKKMSSQNKRLVHQRDRVCQRCGHKGSKSNPLTVHHIKPKRSYPELVNDTSNCEILCNDCHVEEHKGG